MTVKRIRVALGVALLGIGLSTGTAAAEVFTGSGISGGVSPNSDQQGPTNTPNGTEGETVTDTPRSLSGPQSTGGTLPFTGTDVAELSVIGLGAIGAGTIMVRRSRARRVVA
jgi:hypothetical protein